MDNTETLARLDRAVAASWRGETLEALKRFIRLESKSPAFDAAWEERGLLLKAVEEAAAHGRRLFPQGAFEVLSAPGRTPCLFFDVPAAPGSRGAAVMFYGHLDKQPEASGWSEGKGPFAPVVEDGRLYGRGAVDDGYSFYLAMAALSGLDAAGLPRPRALGLIETCEESGSLDLAFWLERLRGRLAGVGLMAVLDAGAEDYGRMWLTPRFRGIVAADLRASTVTAAVHSGIASGAVPSSFGVIRVLLDRIDDAASGRVRDPAFHCAMPEARRAQLERVAAVLGGGFADGYPWQPGARPLHGDALSNLIGQTWMPQLSVTGAEGLPPLEAAGNVIRPETALRLSLRIPPCVDAGAALARLEELLLADPPHGARVTVGGQLASAGWNAPQEAAWFAEAVDAASREVFGQPAGWNCSGGTISIMGLLQQALPGAQFCVTGAAGPRTNSHGPDEMLPLAYAEGLTRALARIIARIP